MNVCAYRKVYLRMLRRTAVASFLLASAGSAWAAGTAVGTSIDNTATVDFTLADGIQTVVFQVTID